MKCLIHPEKIWLRSENEAWFKAYGLWKRKGVELTPYRCPSCRRWHLTHGPKRDIPEWLMNLILKGYLD